MNNNTNREKDTEFSIYCDGGARGNPGPAAIGFVVRDAEGKPMHREAREIGKATNNMAEYQAVIAALEWLAKYKTTNSLPREIRVFLDSRLVVNQLNGMFRVKDAKLKGLTLRVRELERASGLTVGNEELFVSKRENAVSYEAIPREMNTEADSLVNAALDKLPIP